MALFSGAGNGKMYFTLSHEPLLILLNMGFNTAICPQVVGYVSPQSLIIWNT